MKTADFAAHLTEFLSHYLPELKNISTNTISSYCDAFRLFLGYCQDVEGMRIEKLSIDDLTPELVDHFLQWLRIERNNGTATRSQRLAAIRSFVKYLQIKEPRLLLNFQQILAIPVKRAERKAINPLTKEAIALILRQPDTSTLSGRRDATILCFLYDTAARVQEICDLRIEDVRLDYPASVKILGKGRKTRVVPILPATAQNLKKYLTEMHMLAPEKSHLPLFMNRNGQKLTRAGVTYILNKYAKAASVIDPSIPEKIPPHLMRHTKAMHIYDADIQQFLPLIWKYTNVQELTPHILNELIEKIVVHEKEIGEGGVKTQQVDIYYKFIGCVNIRRAKADHAEIIKTEQGQADNRTA